MLENRHWNRNTLENHPQDSTLVLSCLSRVPLVPTLKCAECSCLTLEPSLHLALWPRHWSRTACQVAGLHRAYFQRCKKAGRLGRNRELILFSCPGVIGWKGDALGIFPPVADATVCEEEVQFFLPSPFLFSRVKPEAITLNQAFLLFTLKMLLSLNYEFKLLLKRAQGEGWGALNAARTAEQEMPRRLTEIMPPEGWGRGLRQGYAFSVQQDFSHLHLQPKRFPLLNEIRFCVLLDSLTMVSSGTSLGLSGCWTSIGGIDFYGVSVRWALLSRSSGPCWWLSWSLGILFVCVPLKRTRTRGGSAKGQERIFQKLKYSQCSPWTTQEFLE